MDNLFTAEVLSDWSYSSFWAYSPIRSVGEHPEHSPDTLEFAYLSPDQHGAVVFLEYNDNHKAAAAQLGDTARLILNNFFGGGEDSVNITENNPLPDGSIQLSWGLVKNKTKGTTYVYERGSTILVLSTFYDEAYSDLFANAFAHIANSYNVP